MHVKMWVRDRTNRTGTHRDLRHALVHDVDGIEAADAVIGRELEQHEFGQLRRRDERAGFDEQQQNAGIVSARHPEDLARSVGHVPECPLVSSSTTVITLPLLRSTHQIRATITNVKMMFAARERLNMVDPSWSITTKFCVGASHSEIDAYPTAVRKSVRNN